jgi:hypothetical protein
MITLKNRTMSPAVELFIQHLRAVTKQMRGTSNAQSELR